MEHSQNILYGIYMFKLNNRYTKKWIKHMIEKYLHNRHFYLAQITQSQVLLKIFEKYLWNGETVDFYVNFQILQSL